MNKKEKTYLTVLFLLVLLTLITMSCGIGYYYYGKKNASGDSVNIIVKNINLLLTYENNNKITFKGVEKGLDYNYAFNISNDSNEYNVKYKLLFNTTETSFENETNDFTYSLTGQSFKANDDDILINIDNALVPTGNSVLGEGLITKNQTHFYTLNIKYNGEKNSNIFIGVITLEKAVD